LAKDVRDKTEEDFRCGRLKILLCTSTLSGKNMLCPAR